MSEHGAKMLVGGILVVIGTFAVNAGVVFGALVNLVGGVILLIGIVGAGVAAGNREMLRELQRSRGAGEEDPAER